MSTIQSELRPVARVPLWRNVRVLRVVAQIVALVLAGYAVWTLLDNLTDNLSAVGISTGAATSRGVGWTLSERSWCSLMPCTP